MSTIESAVLATVNDKVSLALKLPETLAHIFRYLSVEDRGKAAVVCSKWREACQQPFLWRDAICEVVLGDHIPVAILRSRRISRFRIRQGNCSWPDLYELLSSVISPQHLDFADCSQMTDTILLTAFQSKMLRVTTLSLLACVRLSDASITLISEIMPNLEILDVSFCKLLTDESLLTIANQLPRLAQLQLNFCDLVTDVGIGYLAGAPFQGQVKVRQVPKIVELMLYGCDLLTNAALLHLSTMKQLQVLDLSFCSRFGDDGLTMLSGLQNLQVLDLSHCIGVQSRGLAALSNMAGLRCLKLIGCRNASIFGLLAMGVKSRIRSLNVTGCRRLGGMALSIIANRLFCLRQLFLDHDHVTARGVSLAAENLQRLNQMTVWQPDDSWGCYTFDRS